MFVSEGNADVAQVGWLEQGSQRWQKQPVMDFSGASAAELWAGRLVTHWQVVRCWRWIV